MPEQWKSLDFEELYGPYDTSTVIFLKEEYCYGNIIDKYGLDRIEWINEYYFDQRSRIYGYRIEAFHLPREYKKAKLVTGGNRFDHTGDYQTLPGSWIIARRDGKYGVFDVRDPHIPVLPFVYDRIDGNFTHLILHKNGLRAYYPISQTPRYAELNPFVWNLARFRLPDGREGWLAMDGMEYIDNEKP